jgi:hypothetical protein
MNVAAVGSSISNKKMGTWLSGVKNRPMVFATEQKQSTVKIEMGSAGQWPSAMGTE